MQMGSGGMGPAGMNLLQMALKMQNPGGAAPAAPASPFAFGTPSGPAPAAPGAQPGMLASLLDPANPGGKNGLLARMRNMMAGGAPAAGGAPGAPMSLAPPDWNNVGPQMPDPGAASAPAFNALTGSW